MPLSPDEIRSRPCFSESWYYILELAPGLFTPGREHGNVALTRDLLRRVDVEGGGPEGGGARAVDIGIQEALVSVLLERRGASRVVGYDRVLFSERITLVQEALDTQVELVGADPSDPGTVEEGYPLYNRYRTQAGYGRSLPLRHLPYILSRGGSPTHFDVVVFSGILYHMLDPFGGLATARTLLRDGGIMVLETLAAFDRTSSLHLNERGRLTPHAYFAISLPALDYLLRMIGLEVLDVVALGRRERTKGLLQGRIGVACRAVPQPVSEPGDDFMTRPRELDLSEFMDLEATVCDLPPVGFEVTDRPLVHRAGGSVDLLASVEAAQPFRPPQDQVKLLLDAKY